MRITALISRLTTSVRHPMAKRAGMLLAALFFIGGIYLSLTSSSFDEISVGWSYVIFLTFAGAPATLALNTMALKVSASAVAVQLSTLAAVRLTVLSSAANFLPIPGGAVIRVSALKMGGSTYQSAISITAYAAIFWVAIALTVAGIGLAGLTSSPTYLAIMTLGITLGVAAYIGASSVAGSQRTALRLVFIAFATHLVATLRFWLAFKALGISLSLAESAVIAASGTAGAMVAIIPGGFGINEAVAALLAQLTGQAAATGFLAATVNRLANYVIRGPLAIIFVWTYHGAATDSADTHSSHSGSEP
jgi:hypothetical protein